MCFQHPKYKPTRRPYADCLLCWEEYLTANPEAPVLAKDLRRLLFVAFRAKGRVFQIQNMWKDWRPE